jgi:carboxymethylenebutenolidase
MDYFGRTAGLTARDDSFEFMPHVLQAKPATIFADAAASLAHMRAQVGADNASFSVGFCFGGALSFLCGTQDLGLAGVIGFYAVMVRDFGNGTLLNQAGTIRTPALGLFGGADQVIPADAWDRVRAFIAAQAS